MLATILLRVVHLPNSFLKNSKIKIYKIEILPAVLCGCETWSLMTREDDGLRVYENRVLRRRDGPKQEAMVGGWRRLQNEKLCNLYTSPNIIWVIKSRRMRWAGHAVHMGEMRNAQRTMLGWILGK
jgi:hypothetical protein